MFGIIFLYYFNFTDNNSKALAGFISSKQQRRRNKTLGKADPGPLLFIFFPLCLGAQKTKLVIISIRLMLAYTRKHCFRWN